MSGCARGVVIGIFFVLLPTAAAADSGDLRLELAGGTTGLSSVDLLLGGTLGLGDYTFARGRGGLVFSKSELDARGEVSAGYIFDVLRWVPELSIGAAFTLQEDEVVLSGMMFAGVRYYVARDSYFGFEAGGDLSADGLAGLLRLIWAP